MDERTNVRGEMTGPFKTCCLKVGPTNNLNTVLDNVGIFHTFARLQIDFM